MTGDFSKLPKWAQNEITNLHHQVASRDAKILELSMAHPDSNVQVSGSLTYPDFTLPPDSEVDFYLGESRQKFRDTVSVRHLSRRPGRLYVSSSGSLLRVHPVASNVIEISLESM